MQPDLGGQLAQAQLTRGHGNPPAHALYHRWPAHTLP
jgi:hypothetical protein